jgi:hypothetical protein
MSKLDIEAPIGGGVPEFFVKTHRLARPPTPWTWSIYKDGWVDACHRSRQSYRSAEEAWAVGSAMLYHLSKHAGR